MSTLFATAVLVVVSTVIGQGLLSVCGQRRQAPLAPAVGLACLIALTSVGVQLSDGVGPAIALVALALALAGWRLVRDRAARPAIESVGAGVATLLLFLLAFLACNRIGLPGMSINNDMSVHLVWAESIRSSSMMALYPPADGYPLGPHSLVATLATVTGARMDAAFTALLIAVPVTMAAAATAVATACARWRAMLIGLGTAATYLATAYFAQGSFKETLVALFFLTFVLYLRGAVAGTGDRRIDGLGVFRVARVVSVGAVPAAVLVGAAVYSFSHLALAWPAAFIALWPVLALLANPGVLLSRTRRRAIATAGAAGAVGLLVPLLLVLAPNWGRIHHYLSAFGAGSKPFVALTDLGNLAAPLPSWEGLGVWMRSDYRFPPADIFAAGGWSGFALAVLLFGIAWATWRRDFALVAAVTAGAIVYFWSKDEQSPYVAAKALIIPGPVVVLTGLRALLGDQEGHSRFGRASRTAFGLVFAFAVLKSSVLALGGTVVAPTQQFDEMDEFRSIIGSTATLFLGNDDFVAFETRGARVAALRLAGGYPPPLGVTGSSKPWVPGDMSDWDSVPTSELDRFGYVIIPHSSYVSTPPENWRLVRSLRLFELWKREGPTPVRQNIDESNAPGAVLNCRKAVGRNLSRIAGVAAVRTPPVITGGIPTLVPGLRAVTAMTLPPGTWDLALRYNSNYDLDVTINGETDRAVRVPPYLGRLGPYVYAGRTVSTGENTLVDVYAHRESRVTTDQAVVTVVDIAATRVEKPRIVPLSKACGKYVDWYEPSS